jgi:hypothetical protein
MSDADASGAATSELALAVGCFAGFTPLLRALAAAAAKPAAAESAAADSEELSQNAMALGTSAAALALLFVAVTTGPAAEGAEVPATDGGCKWLVTAVPTLPPSFAAAAAAATPPVFFAHVPIPAAAVAPTAAAAAIAVADDTALLAVRRLRLPLQQRSTVAAALAALLATRPAAVLLGATRPPPATVAAAVVSPAGTLSSLVSVPVAALRLKQQAALRQARWGRLPALPPAASAAAVGTAWALTSNSQWDGMAFDPQYENITSFEAESLHLV